MRRLLAIGCAVALFAACSGGGGDSGGGGGDVAFHAEAPVLPGFSYDTGLQPGSGPAQISFKLAAAGSHVADTAASRNGGKLVGKAGAGTFKLDMHVKLEGRLKVDAGSVKYDGDVPGLKNVDIPITGTSPFDGLLLEGDPVKLNADVPETKLPDIPLGSVPGHLSLTIATGTHITSTFHGTCLAVKGGQATFAGATSTSGTIVLKSAIVLDVPLVKPIDLPPITVNVPPTSGELDSTPVKVDGADDATQGSCSGPPASSSSGGTDSGPDSGADPDTDSGPDSGPDSGSDSGPDSGATATVILDAVMLNIDDIQLWAPNPTNPSEYDLFIKVSGPGVPAGSDIAIFAYTTGTMCGAPPKNDIVYRPNGDQQYGQVPLLQCGLTIASLPTMSGASLSGNFVGPLGGRSDATKRHSLDVHFDAPRAQ